MTFDKIQNLDLINKTNACAAITDYCQLYVSIKNKLCFLMYIYIKDWRYGVLAGKQLDWSR